VDVIRALTLQSLYAQIIKIIIYLFQKPLFSLLAGLKKSAFRKKNGEKPSLKRDILSI
jgi:hypothetical protein